jgi:transposase
METFGKLRRRHLVKGESISAIARDIHLSRNTVRTYVAAQTGEPRYIRKHQAFPQLGPFRETLTAWLDLESQRPVRERRTAMRLFEALHKEGYRGGYDSVRRFVKRWKQAQGPSVTQAFVPLAFAPGAKYQFDWSHEVVELGDVLQTVKVAHFRLCYSRQSFVVAYPRETQEMVFDAHNRAFACWGGVPLAGIYDNPKTLVDAILVGKERQFNRRFLALMNHYLIEPIACTPAAGWEKGEAREPGGHAAGVAVYAPPQVRPLRGLERLGIASCAARSSGSARIRTRRNTRLGKCSRRSAFICAPSPRRLTATSSTPCGCPPPAWYATTAIATARRPPTRASSSP